MNDHPLNASDPLAWTVAVQFFTLIADGQLRLAYEGMTLQSFRHAVSFEEFSRSVTNWNLDRYDVPQLHYGQQVTRSCVTVKGSVLGNGNTLYDTTVLVDEEGPHCGIAGLMVRDLSSTISFSLPTPYFNSRAAT